MVILHNALCGVCTFSDSDLLTGQSGVHCVVLHKKFNLSSTQLIGADAFDAGVAVLSRGHGKGALHCSDAFRAGDCVVCE